ncbi:hypothetical protein JHK84_056823 [Glycine max]|uniref:Uncharacterized protein n=2 Tax=Glycine subgen. Soja TaxID=1462606 RepID=A0A0R0EQ05_SOYBN|nr:hypothetical protein JHK86_056778 [Glycine max]KAG4910935.1 hypothetical protein JHK87_057051 [Glycine soja]KAG4919515.1 hypothetical protein JHK85_057796 [Glycine max]KAG5075592.1 hypothetical protein JHK84_056823 [Glycine max]KAH1037049.1 hypothetical protein GYH30_056459 [Glycine max]
MLSDFGAKVLTLILHKEYALGFASLYTPSSLFSLYITFTTILFHIEYEFFLSEIILLQSNRINYFENYSGITMFNS